MYLHVKGRKFPVIRKPYKGKAKNEEQNKRLIHLESYYFKNKKLLEDLEKKLGLKERDQDPISICLQVEHKGKS